MILSFASEKYLHLVACALFIAALLSGPSSALGQYTTGSIANVRVTGGLADPAAAGNLFVMVCQDPFYPNGAEVANDHHFSYRDAHGNVWDSWYGTAEVPVKESGKTYGGPSQPAWWHWQVNAGGSPAAGNLFVSVYHNQEHWGYIDASGAVQDAWFGATPQYTWHLQQINTTPKKTGNNSKAPIAAGSLFVSEYNGQHHWGYIDQDGGVQDVWFDGNAGSPWSWQQINTTPKRTGNNSKAPTAAGSLFVSEYNGQHHWGYIGRDGGVQDVWFNGHTGNPWNLQQLNMK